MELPDPPQGWTLKGLLEINEGQWSAHLWRPSAYVYGYGSAARYAMLDAIKRIEAGDWFDRLSGYSKRQANIETIIDAIMKVEDKEIEDVARGNRDNKRRF